MGTTCRMKYSPQICTSHYKSYTTKDLAYMCCFYGVISSREIAVALGRTQKSVLNKVARLRKNGEFEAYKKMYVNM